jgi:hypothetical protein
MVYDDLLLVGKLVFRVILIVNRDGFCLFICHQYCSCLSYAAQGVPEADVGFTIASIFDAMAASVSSWDT